jgi:hypothetical protein
MRKQQLNVPAGFLSYARSRTLGSAQPVAALDGRVKAIRKPLVDLQVKKTASAHKRLPFADCAHKPMAQFHQSGVSITIMHVAASGQTGNAGGTSHA